MKLLPSFLLPPPFTDWQAGAGVPAKNKDSEEDPQGMTQAGRVCTCSGRLCRPGYSSLPQAPPQEPAPRKKGQCGGASGALEGRTWG